MCIRDRVLMSRAAYFGGAIRHPETEAAQAISIDASVPTLARTWGLFVQDHSWVWPACFHAESGDRHDVFCRHARAIYRRSFPFEDDADRRRRTQPALFHACRE